MPKYPPTERVTAGKLSIGDLLLIRERVSDGLPLKRDGDAPPTPWDALHTPGTYRVAAVKPYHRWSGRKRSAYYEIALEHQMSSVGYTIDVAAIQRMNRIVR